MLRSMLISVALGLGCGLLLAVALERTPEDMHLWVSAAGVVVMVVALRIWRLFRERREQDRENE
jgi:membrane protein DedA with SNARE-associated domain